MDAKLIFCVEVKKGGNYLNFAREGVLQIPLVSRRTYLWNKLLLNLFPRKIRRSLGLILPQEINCVIDGSGFGYGDVWDDSIDTRYLRRAEKVKKNGGVVILVPQALGPFTMPKSFDNFRRISDAATKIYVRDEISYEYALSVNPRPDKFSISPDFTNLLENGNIAFNTEHKNRVCIVPNYKMVVHEEKSGQYIAFLTAIVSRLKEIDGMNPFFLVHEGIKDNAIAVEVNKKLASPVEIVWHDNPLLIKAIIRNSKFAVVSRYHALVSALSQAVPVIATSWSHKYKMLMRDYDNEHFLTGISEADKDTMYKLIDELERVDERERVIVHLKKYAEVERIKSIDTWNEVRSLIVSKK